MRARGDACVIMFAQNRGGLLGFRHVCMCGYVKVWMEPGPEGEGQVRVYASTTTRLVSQLMAVRSQWGIGAVCLCRRRIMNEEKNLI